MLHFFGELTVACPVRQSSSSWLHGAAPAGKWTRTTTLPYHLIWPDRSVIWSEISLSLGIIPLAYLKSTVMQLLQKSLTQQTICLEISEISIYIHDHLFVVYTENYLYK